MKPEKLWATLELYDKAIGDRGQPAERMAPHACDQKRPPDDVLLRHCRWMCRHCLTAFRLEFETGRAAVSVCFDMADPAGSWKALFDRIVAAREPLEKAARWLGYVQGVCNSLGLFSVYELRDHSRGESNAPRSAEPR